MVLKDNLLSMQKCSKAIMIAGLFSLFFLYHKNSNAQDAKNNSAATEKIVDVRGRESIVEELNMGPEATELWRAIQIIVERKKPLTLSELKEILKLNIKDEYLKLDFEKIPVKFIMIEGGWRGQISEGRYGVGIDSSEEHKRFLGFNIKFNQNLICISKMEIRKLYKTGGEISVIDSESQGYADQTGYVHGIGLRPHNGGFDIAPSGCASEFGFIANIE